MSPQRPSRLRTVALTIAAVVVAVPFAAYAASGANPFAGPAPRGGLEAPDGGSRGRPLGPGQIESFVDGHLAVQSYGLSYYCPTEAFADLNPPNSNGNGIPAAADPAEFQVPQCVVGDSGTGSIPTVGPSGVPIAVMPRIWGIVPAFGGVGGNTLDPETNTHVHTQCPEPGPPVSQRTGDEFTCAMHPSALHAAHTDSPLGTGPDPALLPRHSHIFEAPASSGFNWYWGNVAFVSDPDIWPDRNGNCRAGESKCLTSLAALRAAQANHQATADEPTNLFFFIKLRLQT